MVYFNKILMMESHYISDYVHFNLLFVYVQECQLDTVSVVKSVVCEQLHRSHFSAITSLLKIIDEKHVLSDADWDDVICMALMEITSKNMEVCLSSQLFLAYNHASVFRLVYNCFGCVNMFFFTVWREWLLLLP